MPLKISLNITEIYHRNIMDVKISQMIHIQGLLNLQVIPVQPRRGKYHSLGIMHQKMLSPLRSWKSFKVSEPTSSSTMSMYNVASLTALAWTACWMTVLVTLSVLVFSTAFTATIISVSLMCGVSIHS